MTQFERISADRALELINNGTAQVVDIRDKHSFDAGHVRGAYHLDNESVATFMANADKTAPVIVCCYHGHSSQSAAAFLAEQGFEQSFSLDGGYEMWHILHPTEID